MATSVKISSKNQIVVPSGARRSLGLEAGDRLIVSVREDGVIEMRKAPEDPAARLEGLIPRPRNGEDLWPEARGE